MTHGDLPPDDALVARIRSGDETVMEELLTAFWDPLVRYAEGIVQDPAGAEDVVQEVFIRLWTRRERWGAEGSVRALLYTMARHAALDEKRRRGRRDRVARRAESSPRPPSPADDTLDAELRHAAAAAVSALPPKRQEVFRLVREEGLSYKEIAAVLEISPQTVANQMSLALADLRASLTSLLRTAPESGPADAGGAPPTAIQPGQEADW